MDRSEVEFCDLIRKVMVRYLESNRVLCGYYVSAPRSVRCSGRLTIAVKVVLRRLPSGSHAEGNAESERIQGARGREGDNLSRVPTDSDPHSGSHNSYSACLRIISATGNDQFARNSW